MGSSGGKVILVVLLIGGLAAGAYYFYSRHVKATTGSAPSSRAPKAKQIKSVFPGVAPSGLERALQGDAGGAWEDFLEIIGVKQVQKDLGKA